MLIWTSFEENIFLKKKYVHLDLFAKNHKGIIFLKTNHTIASWLMDYCFLDTIVGTIGLYIIYCFLK